MDFRDELAAAVAHRETQWRERLRQARADVVRDANSRGVLNSTVAVAGYRDADLSEAHARADDLFRDASLFAESCDTPINAEEIVGCYVQLARQHARGLDRQWLKFRDAHGIAAMNGEDQLADTQQRLIESHIGQRAPELRLQVERVNSRIRLAEQTRRATEAQITAAAEAHRAAHWQFGSAMIAIVALTVSILADWKDLVAWMDDAPAPETTSVPAVLYNAEAKQLSAPVSTQGPDCSVPEIPWRACWDRTSEQ